MRARRSREEWERIVSAFETSGLTALEFARRRNLASNTLRCWKWKLRGPGARRAAPRALRVVAVDVGASVPAAPHLEIAIGGIGIRVPVGADVAYVAALLVELRSRC